MCISDAARHRCWCPDKIAHAGRGDITCVSGPSVLGVFLHHAGFTCARLSEIDLQRHCGNWLRPQSRGATRGLRSPGPHLRQRPRDDTCWPDYGDPMG